VESKSTESKDHASLIATKKVLMGRHFDRGFGLYEKPTADLTSFALPTKTVSAAMHDLQTD
jgi:hypothetical protein